MAYVPDVHRWKVTTEHIYYTLKCLLAVWETSTPESTWISGNSVCMQSDMEVLKMHCMWFIYITNHVITENYTLNCL